VSPTEEAERLRRRRPALEARSRVLRACRDWFHAQGFLEVDTPARVPAPGQEVHLDAFPAGQGQGRGSGGPEPRWLVTSPEYAMKRLCGAGFERIVSIGKCWRAGERGPHHQPEFTMIEWYRANEPLEKIADDCQQVVGAAVAAAGGPSERARVLGAPFARTTVRDLVSRHAGIDLDGDETAAALAGKARAAGIDPGTAAAWDDVFFQIWLDRVEPALAAGPPTLVFDWPAPLGALARRRADDSRLCERFELYAAGLELANAFGELVDPVEQRARFQAEAALRRARGKAVYPIDEALLGALSGMPPTAGVALGFDRLLMAVLGVPRIADVVAFADDEV
jgi:elongation factor P--(R)-beta-lysine ligase